MASVVKLSKEEQEDLSKYIISFLKNTPSGIFKFDNKKLKNDYDSIFTGPAFVPQFEIQNEKKETFKEMYNNYVKMTFSGVQMDKFEKIEFPYPVNFLWASPTKYLTYIADITQREMSSINECKVHLLKGSTLNTLVRLYEDIERYNFIFAVLGATLREFAKIKENNFEYYISLLILKTPIKTLDTVFSREIQSKYNTQIAALANWKWNDLTTAVTRKESQTESNPSSNSSSNTSPIVEPSNPQTPSSKTSPKNELQCSSTDETNKILRSMLSEVNKQLNDLIILGCGVSKALSKLPNILINLIIE